ncbi:hypothetical protein GCM10007063_24990 [Lentibacillus kapialis]|uniref:CDP-glycerol glycerophosphotransferase family protein n=1 Tax=Lentibacillus kapialis TaxID=340214 RepID=A0A917PZH6_9BACI|nr:CDP-glycerol glycerophosphotransferase family protein [Lentibacillus kapialis]GGK01680.1 hypothetical protein GCM10007063_24990 [Lentibacillus kapialis]
MVREIVITVYLFVFRALFVLFKVFPKTAKTTFVVSFGHNALYTMSALEKLTDQHIIILKSRKCCMMFQPARHRRIIMFQFPYILDWIRSVYHLATSENVFVDNYYGFLSVTDFSQQTQCIQLWHAAGAIKKFGLKDQQIKNRHPIACRRFKNVYKRFDYVVVGSEKMTAIFAEAFHVPAEQHLRTGVPRTDFFFDVAARKKTEQSLTNQFPIIREKKVILYAPTYRDDQLNTAHIKLNIRQMYTDLGDEYVLFLSLHPKMTSNTTNDCPGFVYDISHLDNINHVLAVTDILISDYSSVPFEFSLMHKPMVFYAYDLESYAHMKGFWKDYEDLVPGPVVTTTDELIRVITHHEFKLEQVEAFANEWNHYSTGNSSEKLVQRLYQ